MKATNDPNDEHGAPGNPNRRLLEASMAAMGAAALAAQASLELDAFASGAAAPAPAPTPAGTASKTAPAGATAAARTAVPVADVRLDFMKSVAVKAPATTPFVVPLTIPPVKQPESWLSPRPTKEAQVGMGEAGRLPHQAWERYQPRRFYRLRVREEDHEFHPELPKQKIWGYDGTTPGPTFVVRYGEPIVVRIENDLPTDHRGFGSPEISTHLHNGHTPSESDGFPGDYYSRDKYGPTLTRAGRWKDHHYPNNLSNAAEFPSTDGDPSAALGTLWYHDHRMEFTSPNVYRGLAGFYLIFDGVDTGDERDPDPRALRLPSGVGQYDIPLVFQDRNFDSGGYLYFNQFDPEGVVGEKFLVNGKIQPYFSVTRRKYRFRCLNGSSVRFYQFYLVHETKEQKFIQVSNDGNLLPAPLEVDKLRLATAERGDIVIDFARFPLGSKVYLVNRLEHIDGRGPTGNLLTPGTPILRFDVDRDLPPGEVDPSQVPAVLRPLAAPVIPKNVRTRKWVFDRENDQWTVNNKLFDINTPAAIVKRGVDEIWELKTSSGWSHPVHIHFEEARLLTRNGLPPPMHERGRKDVFELHPGETVRILICFDDFIGKYIMHCHNTVHEDHHMMVRFDVIP